ncbi:MAG TPA: hypothetical protein VHY20_11545 [Pirellulales bacterium]|jgi:hypothetical protein|nr:hypothetical protein [Pirellulales bacterium]
MANVEAFGRDRSASASTQPAALAYPPVLVAWARHSLLGSLAIAAAVLVIRRWSGALADPLSPVWLPVVGLAAVLTARLGRAPLPRANLSSGDAWPTLSCLAIAWALSLPGASKPSLAALWAVVLMGEGWWWTAALRKWPARLRLPALPLGAVAGPAGDSSVVQQSRRDRGPNGQERVAGWLRVELAAGQRVAQAHVAFCPPLERTPAIELRQTTGPAARLKLGQALVYGARFELKLAAPGPASITLEYTATTAAGPAPAAT